MTKIMLVEDDKSLREIYSVRLLAEGYDVISAGDGEAALAMAVKEKPDLILSDVMMPKISGFDMLDILRSTPETKDVKVVMMTALSSEDQRSRGESLGADRYLVKSQVGIEDVVRAIHDVLTGVEVVQPPQIFEQPVETVAAPTPPVINNPLEVTPTINPVETIVNPIAQPQPVIPQPAVVPVIPQAPAVPPAPVVNDQYVSTLPPAAPIEPIAPINTMPEPPAATLPQPSINPAPIVPTDAPIAPVAPVQLPQPIAPFSTPAPASLGDRIINPIAPTTPPVDIEALMNKELLNDGSTTSPQAPPQF